MKRKNQKKLKNWLAKNDKEKRRAPKLVQKRSASPGREAQPIDLSIYILILKINPSKNKKGALQRQRFGVRPPMARLSSLKDSTQ
jgi:hypothetical protein